MYMTEVGLLMRTKHQTRQQAYFNDEDPEKALRSKNFQAVMSAINTPYAFFGDEQAVSKTVVEQLNGKKITASVAKVFKHLFVTYHNKVHEDFYSRIPKFKTIVITLVNLTSVKWMWVNQPESWKPETQDSSNLYSLIYHLVGGYKLPRFMYKAWLEDASEKTEIQRQWFLNLSFGQNIRKQKKLPIPLSKKAAHWFVQAPDSCSINEAFRWATVRGLGANERVAKGMMGTFLASSFFNQEQEAFWASVVRFFADNPMLDTAHYGPICDLLFNQKYADNAPQPNLSMKGREPLTLLRQTEEWHERLRAMIPSNYRNLPEAWKSCGIEGFETKFADGIWTINEVTSLSDLYTEGEEMHHCVISYARSCAEGRIAIYSVKKRTKETKPTRELTVEIDTSQKEIVQARKVCNYNPTDEDLAVMNLWAKARGLKVNPHIS